jgi:hypothetical protein
MAADFGFFVTKSASFRQQKKAPGFTPGAGMGKITG